MQMKGEYNMMKPNNHPPMQSRPCSCNVDLQRLRALDFAIQDTVLYLDAYPDCKAALDYYHQLVAQRKESLAAYEKTYGPLTMYGNQSRSQWDWVDTPWPWEPEAN